MTFERKPLKLIETRKIELPTHPISSINWMNTMMNGAISLLEQKLLSIPRGTKILECTYESPITTEYEENNVVRVRHYNSSDNSAVIVLPQRGSGYSVSQLIASYLYTNGISAYEIETPFHGSRLPKGMKSMCEIPMDLNRLKIMFSQAVTETRGLIALLKEENIGIFGISLGAIYASIVYGIEERVSKGCLVLGGGNFPDLILRSNDEFIRNIQKFVKESELLYEDVRKELEEIDPCNYTNPKKTKGLVMVNATQDKIVPEKNGQELRMAWNYPKQYLIDADHIGSIRFIPGLLSDLLVHYKCM